MKDHSFEKEKKNCNFVSTLSKLRSHQSIHILNETKGFVRYVDGA